MKRFTALLLSFLMVLTLCVTTLATGKSCEYVAFGDSITSMIVTVDGVSTDFSSIAYPASTAAKMGWSVRNLGATGWRTNELRFILEDDYTGDAFLKEYLPTYSKGRFHMDMLKTLRDDYRKAIAEADVITLSFGSNDLMGNLDYDLSVIDFYSTMAGLNSESVVEKVSSLMTFAKILSSSLLKVELNFQENWDCIVRDIRQMNPDVTIIALGLYNLPSKGIAAYGIPESMYDLIRIPLGQIDKYIRTSPYHGEYQYVDISEVTFEGSPDDMHPGKVGHAYIADQIIAAYSKACKHEKTVTLFGFNPPCLHVGYSGDTYCTNCHALVQRGEVTTLSGKTYQLPKHISREIFKAVTDTVSHSIVRIFSLSA